MFSFFKKSKKEAECGLARDKKSRERDVSKRDGESPTPNADDTCKNKSGPSRKYYENASGSPENACATSDNAALADQQDPNVSNSNEMNHQLSGYANKRTSVKPCGHGTVAISPRVPAMGKTNSVTPPASPKLDLKKTNSEKVHSEAFVPLKASTDNEKPTTKRITNCDLGGEPPAIPTPKTENEMKNLINQEAKFQSQLNELSKQLAQRDAEASKLRFQMEELQRDVFAKSAGVDRLQTELQAAHKETENVRQKLKHLEEELAEFKEKNGQLVEEINKKSEYYQKCETEAKAKISELEEVIKELNIKIRSLESQIEELSAEKSKLEKEHTDILGEKEEQKKAVEKALEEAIEQKATTDKKWEQEFEKLRTVNIVKEEQMLDDFEWKLREVEQACKKRLQEKDRNLEERLQEACKNAEEKLKLAEGMMEEVKHLKSYEAEVKQLRGLTQEQERSIQMMAEQQEQMQSAEQSLKDEARKLRTLIEIEKENLQHMQRLHNQEIMDKERTLQNRLEQKKTEIAMYWEERLLHECGRLKSELEQLHNEEKSFAIDTVRRQKNEELEEHKKKWNVKLEETLKDITSLQKSLAAKDEYYHHEMITQQSNTDRDIMELRRLMDKIDMTHHENFERLVQEHEEELERINEETEKRLQEVEESWQHQVSSLRATLELVKEQMEKESQQKIQMLIDQHRSELDTQWANLIHQKSEAIKLVEDEYVSKYSTLEGQFYTQQKSHEAREVELLKTIDSLKNEITSKDSTIDDLQNNVDTLEGGIQVLNQEIAQQGDHIMKVKRDSDFKIRGLQEEMAILQVERDKERDQLQTQMSQAQKQSQATIDHLQKKCQCLSKLFEEVRARYERRESRQEDINIISDLKQIIAEQEKDLACINEEKRYYQMKLMSLQRSLEDDEEDFVDSEDFASSEHARHKEVGSGNAQTFNLPNGFQQQQQHQALSIPPTIPECDDSDDV